MTAATLHTLGFPRIGPRRELKKALESYWKGELDRDALKGTGRQLRQRHRAWQKEAGMDHVPAGDFSFYDHVLDMMMTLSVTPERFAPAAGADPLDRAFYMARGRATGQSLPDVPALEMTKWFDTNYHYLVPELTEGQTFAADPARLLDEVREAREDGVTPRPVLLGPVSFLYLSKMQDTDRSSLELLERLIPAYREILDHLAQAGVEWVQMDEPVLVLDLPTEWQSGLRAAYQGLENGGPKLLLTSYFGRLGAQQELALELPVAGLHVDAVRGAEEVSSLVDRVPDDKVLSLGIVDGRNIWANDLAASLDQLEPAFARLGERLWLGTSCSLLHVPVDLEQEPELDGELRSWLAFARQKLVELQHLGRGVSEGREAIKPALEASQRAQASRASSRRVHRSAVHERVGQLKPEDARRQSNYERRAQAQHERLNLPLYPTTSIGSFPQTSGIRRARRDWKRGELTDADYQRTMRNEVQQVIRFQEEIGMDVLVHGEPERNDMVEYFGEQLEGYAFTRLGWVQSYGSRCVKPPIIFGDVERPNPMTVEWARYAQSLTDRPVKGMLTGPVTMLQWSFVRDDQPRKDTALQIALALRDEVCDLAAAGIAAIQVDEPAFREGLPLRRSEWAEYLDWATHAFRVATSGVADDVQIHTHMCYSEFNDIIDSIASLDADVITIETSRSNMELLEAFERTTYPNEIGPGVYDIHSPRIPESEEMLGLMLRAADRIPPQRLWVNPDCGLKTRQWDEVRPSLERMVQTAQKLRDSTEPARFSTA